MRLKRIISGIIIFCLLLLLGGAGWILYRQDGELTAFSSRTSELSEKYEELSQEYQRLSEEHAGLSGEHEELSQGALALLQHYLEARGHGTGTTESVTFTESNRILRNPNRGFYHMHGFRINDDVSDFRENVAGRFAKDQDTSLTLIQINLQEFRKGEISEQGLKNLENLFETLAGVDKQLVIRFLYDWSGQNLRYEPDSLDVILRHMEQVAPFLKKFKDRIFLVQGVFVGNNGEMHSSKHLGEEDMRKLACGLYQATDEDTFLSVRTPAHWRIITETENPEHAVRGDGTITSRLGLFNDGMLGSSTDCGTYGDTGQTEQAPFSKWGRSEELDFQNVLCRVVPNGGEVIIDNEYNDFENALADMKTMHVTYLNRDYDTDVLDKWERTTVREDSCFDGMDGLSYMERHLGYRLVLRESALDYDWKTDRLTARITLQNVGFAPIYKEAQVKLVLYDRERGREYAYALEAGQDIRNLAGGTDAQELMTLSWELPLGGLPDGELEIYFSVTDLASGEMILLGNEQEPDSRGYRAGTLKLEGTEELREQLRQEFFPQMQDVLTGGEDRDGNDAGN